MLCSVAPTGSSCEWWVRNLRRAGSLGIFILLLAWTGSARAAEESGEASGRAPESAGAGSAPTVAEVVAKIRPSLATIRVVGRDASGLGLGTGFVISSDGLIATNLHVIGQGRQFTIEMADGQKLEPIAIHAFDQAVDLAVIRVHAAEPSFKPLELAEPGRIQQGEAVVAMGNPWGLRNSVVSGVVSALREIDGQELLQLAMPIEPGNSGGPLVDMAGRVHGVINMKSTVQQNVAFAIKVDKLKALLERPNPIPIDRWVTIGAMDKREWQTLFGAAWRQHAGRIQVSGQGQGYGGRSLCLSSLEVPEPPYEVGVSVKLENEDGAAGLVFHADGKDKHYGFYPSNGSLRFSCFRGPDVYTWQVLHDRPSEHYRKGTWNYLKVRVEPDRLLCFVNDQLVLESTDRSLTSGRIGLAKFRQTVAEFKDFRVAKELPSRAASAEQLAAVAESLDRLPDIAAILEDDLNRLASQSQAAISVMDARRSALEAQRIELQKQIEELERVAEDVRVREIAQQLQNLLTTAEAAEKARPAAADSTATEATPARAKNDSQSPAEPKPASDNPPATENTSAPTDAAESTRDPKPAPPKTDEPRDVTDVLLRGALLIARLDERDIDIESYVQQLHAMEAEIRADLAEDTDEATRLTALDNYLFVQNGFHGSRFDYDHRANSYMNRVMDDREGLPITLSVLYMELGRRLGLRIDGLSLPGRFAVRWVSTTGEERIIDVFDGARTMTRDDVSKIVQESLKEKLNDEHLRASTHREILGRMLNNLYNAAEQQADRAAMLRYLEARLVIEPDSIPYRGMRAVLRAESGRRAAAVADLDWIIEKQPPGVDLEQIMRMRETFSRSP